MAAPEGTPLVCLCGRWPRLVGGLWREVNYTVTRLMHSECGRICRGAVGEGGGLIRGGLLYTNNKDTGTINAHDIWLSCDNITNFAKHSVLYQLDRVMLQMCKTYFDT